MCNVGGGLQQELRHSKWAVWVWGKGNEFEKGDIIIAVYIVDNTKDEGAQVGLENKIMEWAIGSY